MRCGFPGLIKWPGISIGGWGRKTKFRPIPHVPAPGLATAGSTARMEGVTT